MLSMYKWFRVTTYPENEAMLSGAINEFNIVVESERYATTDEEFEWSKKGATRFILECHTSADAFDEFVEYLKEVFKDSWATITY